MSVDPHSKSTLSKVKDYRKKQKPNNKNRIGIFYQLEEYIVEGWKNNVRNDHFNLNILGPVLQIQVIQYGLLNNTTLMFDTLH